MAVADPGSCSVLRMPDAFHPEDTGTPYHITKLVTADKDMSRLVGLHVPRPSRQL